MRLRPLLLTAIGTLAAVLLQSAPAQTTETVPVAPAAPVPVRAVGRYVALAARFILIMGGKGPRRGSGLPGGVTPA